MNLKLSYLKTLLKFPKRWGNPTHSNNFVTVCVNMSGICACITYYTSTHTNIFTYLQASSHTNNFKFIQTFHSCKNLYSAIISYPYKKVHKGLSDFKKSHR
ncbi:hypothetical protein ACKWTF_003829 [Chironomus riparius]